MNNNERYKLAKKYDDKGIDPDEIMVTLNEEELSNMMHSKNEFYKDEEESFQKMQEYNIGLIESEIEKVKNEIEYIRNDIMQTEKLLNDIRYRYNYVDYKHDIIENERKISHLLKKLKGLEDALNERNGRSR